MAPTGVWSLLGYNTLFEIDANGDYDAYTLTTKTCAKHPLPGNLHEEDGALVRVNDDRYQLVEGNERKLMSRLDALPQRCADQDTADKTNALVNFEAFWSFLSENHAFLSQRQVDWDAARDAGLKKLTATSDQDRLWTVLAETVGGIEDGHLWLGNDIMTLLRGRFDGIVTGRHRSYMNAYFDKNVSAGRAETVVEARSRYKRQALQYLDNVVLGEDFQSTSDNRMIWGLVAPDVGYVGISTLWGYAGEGMLNGNPATDADVAGSLIDDALAAMPDIEALIVDIRFNGGGDDRVALEIARRFSANTQLAYSKNVIQPNKTVLSQQILLEAAPGKAFTKPVYLLTSEYVASAGEVLTLAMRTLPHVKIVGEETQGIFSNINVGFLPNGWFVTSSNEIYTSIYGMVFEGKGIPPDIRTPSFRPTKPFMLLGQPIEAALADYERNKT